MQLNYKFDRQLELERADAREEGLEEGRKLGQKIGQEEGRKEGRKEGQKLEIIVYSWHGNMEI